MSTHTHTCTPSSNKNMDLWDHQWVYTYIDVGFAQKRKKKSNHLLQMWQLCLQEEQLTHLHFCDIDLVVRIRMSLKILSENITSIKWLCKLLEISPSWHWMSKQERKFCYRMHKKEKLHRGRLRCCSLRFIHCIAIHCHRLQCGNWGAQHKGLPWATWHHESGGVEGRMNVRPVVTYRTGWKLSLC